MDRTFKDMSDTVPEPMDDEQDAFIDFCAENWLDPDSNYAQKLWNEKISYLYG